MYGAAPRGLWRYLLVPLDLHRTASLPPEEALRTSESGYADAAARPRPGIADFDVTPHEGDGEDAFGEQRPPSGRVAGRKGEQRRGEHGSQLCERCVSRPCLLIVKASCRRLATMPRL